MYRILTKLIQRVNFGLALSALGIVLAVLAFWFDVFGFGVDRTESAETTEAIKRVERIVSPKAIRFVPIQSPFTDNMTYKYKAPNGVGTSPYSDTCSIVWGDELDTSYAVSKTERDCEEESTCLKIEIFPSKAQHLFSGYMPYMDEMESDEDFLDLLQEESEYFLTSEFASEPVSAEDLINFQDCEHVGVHSFGGECAQLTLSNRDLALLENYEDWKLRLGGKELSPLIEDDFEGYASILRRVAELFRRDFDAQASDFDKEFEKLAGNPHGNSSALGALAGADLTQSSTTFPDGSDFYSRAIEDNRGRRIVHSTQSADRVRTVYEPQPLPKQLWIPKRSDKYFTVDLDFRSVLEARNIMKACFAVEKSSAEENIVVLE